MDFKARVKYQLAVFLSILFFSHTTSQSQTTSTGGQFDSLMVIEKGEIPEICNSGYSLSVGDTVDLYFKRIMQDGTLIDFPPNQLFRIEIINKTAKTFNILLPNGKLVTNTVTSLPLKLFVMEPGRTAMKAYAINPGEPPDSSHRILSAPNAEIKAKFIGAIGLKKMHIRQYKDSRKYFFEAAELDSMVKKISYYNVACSYALEYDTLNALHWLRLAFENGYFNIIHALKEDKDLESIRYLPEFKPIVTMSLIKERKHWLDEIQQSKDTYNNGVNYYLISETYLKQADPDSFFVCFEKALQNKYCPEAGNFSDSLYKMICNDSRFDSLLIYYSEISKTINIPLDIIRNKTYLATKLHLQSMPDFIGRCHNLKELWVNGDTLKKMPEQIFNCKSLLSLRIDNSGFNEFPIVITKLDSLKSLIITKGNFSNIPEEIANNYRLDTLCLINDGLKSLPKLMCKLTNLKSLILKGNFITELPNEFEQINTLTNLDLSENCLPEIPDAVFKFGKLSTLDIHENLVKAIPSKIENLKNLKRLDIALNNISSLPAGICSLDSLEYLDLSFNNLTDLPASINKLNNLRELIIYGNKIPGEVIKHLHFALPRCKIIGEEQNTFSYKKYINHKMITDTVMGIAFTYPEGYKAGLKIPDFPERDTAIEISLIKLTPVDPSLELNNNDDSTYYYCENTCTAYIAVSENNFSGITDPFYFRKNNFLITGDKSGDYFDSPALWINLGRHNHQSVPSALNLDNWKGLFGESEWLSRIVTKSGEVDEGNEDIHDFYKAIAIKKMSNGRSIYVYVLTDINSEEDILGNLISSIKYIK